MATMKKTIMHGHVGLYLSYSDIVDSGKRYSFLFEMYCSAKFADGTKMIHLGIVVQEYRDGCYIPQYNAPVKLAYNEDKIKNGITISDFKPFR